MRRLSRSVWSLAACAALLAVEGPAADRPALAPLPLVEDARLLRELTGEAQPAAAQPRGGVRLPTSNPAQVTRPPAPAVRPAVYALPGEATAPTTPLPPPHTPGLSLDQLVGLGLANHPRLAKASFAVGAARGRATQAGLYPNPTVGVTFDELFDKTGPGGVNTLPLISQEIVTAGKLDLSRDAGLREADQACWQVLAERYSLLASIRQAYFETLTLQQRVEILGMLVELADASVSSSASLLKAQQIARLDLVQLEVEAERLRADKEAAERELPAAYRRLAAAVGVNLLDVGSVNGTLEMPFPEYDLTATQQAVVQAHPEAQVARFGVQKARLLVDRARVEPIPNLNVDTGYVRQNQNNSNDFRIGANLSVPLWNRNQGNIRAAEAELCEAVQEVRRVENSLSERVATSMRDYLAARARADRYDTAILPRAEETYKLSLEAYQGGQFEYLRVIEAQRALAQANLEYIRALGDAWQAAALLSGLTLEEQWPGLPAGASQPATLAPAR